MTRRYPVNTIRFPERPAPEVLALIKSYGFRWNRNSQSWSAPQSIRSATVCDCVSGGCFDPDRVAEAVGEAEAQCGII